MASNNSSSRYDIIGCINEIQKCGQRHKFLDETVRYGNAVTASGSVEMPVLRQRFGQPARYAHIADNGHGDFLLSQRLESKEPTQTQKVNSFTGCIEKFLSAYRRNVKMLLRSTCRQGSMSEYQKVPRTFPEPQVGSPYIQDRAIACLCRTRRWNVRRLLGDIIKIEEEIVHSVPRSVLYYV